MHQKEQTDPFSEHLSKMATLCARREYAPADIAAKLRQRGVTTELAGEIVDALLDQGFLSTARYANAFVRDKFRFAQWGPRKIRYELAGKAIPGPDIDEALAQLSNEDIADARQKLIHKKCPGYHEATPEEKAKVERFLYTKGF